MVEQKVCTQFIKKMENAEKCLTAAGLNSADVQKLRVANYEFISVPDDDVESKRQINRFIVENEHLGKPHKRTTHRFVAKYRGHLAGVVTFSTPNSFSHILGKDNRDKEKLISRGATSAIACKNLGSALNAFAIDWMVQNTEFRIFTAYSDPEASELGTIYKALNFIFLGTTYGTRILLKDPIRPEKGWFSDREARKLSSYKRLAKKAGIKWESHWNSDWHIHWDLMPSEIEDKLKSLCREFIKSCEWRKPPRKSKWVFIKGRTRKETQKYLNLFKKLNPQMIHGNKLGMAYPSELLRGLYEK